MTTLLTGAPAPDAPLIPPVENGYRGIWYFNQAQGEPYNYKYSGGFATYPQQILPIAVYSPQANKTFFCYGGTTTGKELHNMVSYYDHATKTVAKPRRLLTRQTFDAHYNATLALDREGYLYIFCNCHGVGMEQPKEDPTYAKSYILRSVKPYSIDAFTVIRNDNFSYSQAWPRQDSGIFWQHTRYQGNQRGLFFTEKLDATSCTTPEYFVNIERGDYQISWMKGNRLATAFDFHPQKDGLNARSNIYYLQTEDYGAHWTTIDGKAVKLPIHNADNPALIRDYHKEGKLVYLKDLAFDAKGNPAILYITSHGAWSGPQHDPREWMLAHWNGKTWDYHSLGAATHNYDHGSLYIEDDGTWRIIAPTEPGPQQWGTGGTVTMRVSNDQGAHWKTSTVFPIFSQRNQTYVRKPLNAHPDFYAFWADGDPYASSESDLYFCTREGVMFRLPRTMNSDSMAPEQVYPKR